MGLANINIRNLNLYELRMCWHQVWGIEPHNRIGRKMLERSLLFKEKERSLNRTTYQRLNKLIQNYKRNPNYFEQGYMVLKPGMQILRDWQGVTHRVKVLKDGFEYKNQHYKSLSKIAYKITGSKWNGWVFFNLKNKKDGS